MVVKGRVKLATWKYCETSFSFSNAIRARSRRQLLNRVTSLELDPWWKEKSGFCSNVECKFFQELIKSRGNALIEGVWFGFYKSWSIEYREFLCRIESWRETETSERKSLRKMRFWCLWRMNFCTQLIKIVESVKVQLLREFWFPIKSGRPIGP
jgi:hypothetical protein